MVHNLTAGSFKTVFTIATWVIEREEAAILTFVRIEVALLKENASVGSVVAVIILCALLIPCSRELLF